MKIYHHFEMIYSDWLVKKKIFSIVSLAEAFQKSTAFGLLDFFFFIMFHTDNRRLEICGYGAGSLLPLVVLRGLCVWYGDHHPLSSFTVRHEAAHRH